jgi:hypothetical protein
MGMTRSILHGAMSRLLIAHWLSLIRQITWHWIHGVFLGRAGFVSPYLAINARVGLENLGWTRHFVEMLTTSKLRGLRSRRDIVRMSSRDCPLFPSSKEEEDGEQGADDHDGNGDSNASFGTRGKTRRRSWRGGGRGCGRYRGACCTSRAGEGGTAGFGGRGRRCCRSQGRRVAVCVTDLEIELGDKHRGHWEDGADCLVVNDGYPGSGSDVSRTIPEVCGRLICKLSESIVSFSGLLCGGLDDVPVTASIGCFRG